MENSPTTDNVTYKEYKDDTAQIAGWLAKYAVKVGFKVASSQSQGHGPTPSTRLKGKARKQAKSNSAPTAGGPKYAISVSDFGRMAKAIADAKPQVVIPKTLDNLFSRAINARKTFARWFQDNSHGDVDGSNKRHIHFIDVLSSAWAILRPSENARVSHIEKPKTSNSDQGPLIEPATSSMGQDDDYKLPDIAPVVIEKSQEDLEDDFLFAIFAFMNEVNHVRGCVRRVWDGYRIGVTELMLCSLITNTAIQLVRRAEHELDLTIERPQKYPASSYPASTFTSIFMYMTHVQDMKEDLETFMRPGYLVSTFPTCPHSDLCFWEIFTTLKHSLHEAVTLGKGQYMLPGTVDYKSASGNATPETFNRIKLMIPCFQGVARAMDESFASDEITFGLNTMFKTNTIPIWVAFGVRLLLDIQDELQNVSEKPLIELKQHTRNKLAAHRRRKFNQEPYIMAPGGPQWLTTMLEAYELDACGDNFRKTLIRGMRAQMPGDNVSFELDHEGVMKNAPEYLRTEDYFLRINPVKCGMLKYGLYLQPHHYAASFEAAWRGITATVHLYVACRSLFPDDPVWPDMEFFLHYQDLDNLFVGGLPKSMEEAYKKFMLASGVNATNFARNKRTAEPKVNMDKGRWVSNPCVLDGLYSNWMCGGKVMNDDMVLDLVRVIAEPQNISRKARQAGLAEHSALVTKLSTSSDRHMATSLGDMAFYIMTETADLYFDWLCFAETCQRILDQVNVFLDDEARKSRSPFTTVHKVLDDARRYQWIAEDIAKLKKADVSTFMGQNSKCMIKSWEVFQKLAKKEMKVSFGEDNEHFRDVKTWVGDKEMFGVISKALGESKYPNLSASLRGKVYKNWPSEDVSRSAVLRMDSPGKSS